MGSLRTKQKGAAAFAALFAGLMFATVTARAGSIEEAISGADFESQAAELSRAVSETAGAKDSRYMDMNDLLALLQDRDPVVRKAAVRSSRLLIVNSRVYDRLSYMMRDKREQDDVRLEAARMLSYAATYNRVHEALEDTARNTADRPELRIMAYKSLWSAANGYSRVRDFLVQSVNYEKDPALRRAAIWALFDVKNNSTRDFLVYRLRYGKEDEATKTEIIKSLYGAMTYREVQDPMIDIINDRNESRELRKTATLALSGATGYSAVQRFLESMAGQAQDPELRAAAVEALSPSPDRIREYFHLGYRLQNGGFINPIEKE